MVRSFTHTFGKNQSCSIYHVIKILALPLMHRERHGNEQKKNEGCKACHCMPQRLNLSYVKAIGERFRDEGQGV
jgi:hypothetical protein